MRGLGGRERAAISAGKRAGRAESVSTAAMVGESHSEKKAGDKNVFNQKSGRRQLMAEVEADDVESVSWRQLRYLWIWYCYSFTAQIDEWQGCC